MTEKGQACAIDLVLRCYPKGWRERYGDETRQLVSDLIDDGRSPAALALDGLFGAIPVRFRAMCSWCRLSKLQPRIAVAAVLALGLIGTTFSLLQDLTPASASNARVVLRIGDTGHVVNELQLEIRRHDYTIVVREEPARSAKSIGAITSIHLAPSGPGVTPITGPCPQSRQTCVVGVALPVGYRGHGTIVVGISPTPR